MCQLLGISSDAPFPTFSSSFLSPFVQRGGNTDVHSHGWGVAYYNYCNEQKKLRLKTIRDASPAATSSKVQALINDGSRGMLETRTLLAHIRYATVGEVAIQNVHPFNRTIFGVEVVFAHNGDVPMFKGEEGRRQHKRSMSLESYESIDHSLDSASSSSSPSSHDHVEFLPDGDTDSEHIFCYILNSLHEKFDSFPSPTQLYVFIDELCSEIVQEQNVILNFLLVVGEYMFAYSWPGSRPGSSTWNGLHYMLQDSDSNSIHSHDSKSHAVVIATKPLSDSSSWTEFKRGELILFYNGAKISSEGQDLTQ